MVGTQATDLPTRQPQAYNVVMRSCCFWYDFQALVQSLACSRRAVCIAWAYFRAILIFETKP